MHPMDRNPYDPVCRGPNTVLMCFQNGPHQAAGVVGYQQFPFLNQFDTDVAAAIVAFCDAAVHFAHTNVEVHKAI